MDCKKNKYISEDFEGKKKHRNEYRKIHPEAVCFSNMKARCRNPNNDHYKYYGGRGIKCFIKSWQEIVVAIGPKPTGRYSIDRINNDGHYECGNIKWATDKEQQAHTRRSKCLSS